MEFISQNECHVCGNSDAKGTIINWNHVYPNKVYIEKEIYVELCQHHSNKNKGRTLWGFNWDQAASRLK